MLSILKAKPVLIIIIVVPLLKQVQPILSFATDLVSFSSFLLVDHFLACIHARFIYLFVDVK